MKHRVYTEAEKDEFIQIAQEIGVGPTCRKLGYPSSAQGFNWFKQRGLPIPTIDSLQARAREIQQFYGDNEKKLAIQTLMDRIVEKAGEEQLDADAINKLANALAKLIQTFQLVEGKATTVQESRTKDGSELAIMDMLNAEKAKNALKQSEIFG